MARTLHSVASALDVLDVLAAHEELGVSAVAREVGVDGPLEDTLRLAPRPAPGSWSGWDRKIVV